MARLSVARGRFATTYIDRGTLAVLLTVWHSRPQSPASEGTDR